MVSKRALKLAGLLGIAMALATSAPARAAGDDEDPPSRVARLAYAHGSVSFQPAGTDEWVNSIVNRPMTIGDKLWSDDDSRAEMQLDGSLIRISNNTGVAFLNLSDTATQIQLSAGTLLVRVRRLDDNETYEVDTPNLAFSILRPGLYRLSVNEAGDATIIKVRAGEGEVTGGGAAYHVRRNESESFAGTDQLAINPLDDDSREDQFDAWSANRDAHWAHSSSSRYVSSDVVGYEDLDDHGAWRPTPEYGNVWFPRTERPDWAPYHYGHWAYVAPWGYTWVDDESWGFAPFHYGRWVCVDGSWGWVPSPPRTEGVEYVRPVYAPALVAWVGGGPGGGSGVAWFPLGPREVYVPSYPVSRKYVNNVNVSNTTVNTTVVNNYYNTTVVNQNVNVTSVKYVNQTVPGAVAATTPQAFTTAQPVAKNVVIVDRRTIVNAPVRAFAPASVPTKQAVLGTTVAAVAVKPPAAVQTRVVVAKVAPPPPPPVFEKRQEAIRDNGGKPLSIAQVRQIQPAPAQSAAPVKIAGPAKVAPPQNAQGDRNVNNPAVANKPAPGQPAQANKPGQAEVNRPATVITRQENRPSDRPATLNNAVERSTIPAKPNNAVQPGSRPSDRPANPNNAAQHGDSDRPAAPPTHQLDQKHEQDQDQLRGKQEQEHPQAQQQPEHPQPAQQKPDEAKKQQVEQQHQQQPAPVQDKHPQPVQQKADEPKKPQIEQRPQQTAQPQEKHTQEPQKSQDKQQQPGKNQPKPSKDDRPSKDKP
jgi:hypothetical protein